MLKRKELINTECDSVLSYINPNNNDILSYMSGSDLREFIRYIENYYLELRENLGFDRSVTFGLELEFENARSEEIRTDLNQFLNTNVLNDNWWILKYDASLNNGAEINSPILNDNEKCWRDLAKVCAIVEKNAKIGINSGGHIHIGTQVIGSRREAWLNFIKLWAVYENIIYRFAYGDYLVGRSSIKKYAKPVADTFWKDYLFLANTSVSTTEIIRKVAYSKYQGVNLRANQFCGNLDNFREDKTLEFRCPNGSLEPVVWQNNVNFFVNLLLYARGSNFNDDIVTKRHEFNQDKYQELDDYNEIYLEQALELCDMLFTNNLDKIYFLRQYLKSFQIGTRPLEKAKTFTKTTRK